MSNISYLESFCYRLLLFVKSVIHVVFCIYTEYIKNNNFYIYIYLIFINENILYLLIEIDYIPICFYQRNVLHNIFLKAFFFHLDDY